MRIYETLIKNVVQAGIEPATLALPFLLLSVYIKLYKHHALPTTLLDLE